MMNLPEKARRYTDAQWYGLLQASIEQPIVDGITFPRFPSEAIQTHFVGSANSKTLAEAYNFYLFLKKAAARGKAPLGPDSRFLDFGCGWGRFLRFFWKDVGDDNLHGCDVERGILEVCKTLDIPGKLAHIDPLGTLPYPDAFFDNAMAYSVFTHLPESVHLHWMKELARVLRPGAVFVLTLEPRRFLDFIAQVEEPQNDWHRMLLTHRERLAGYYRDFNAGKFVFMPTNAGIEERYGDAVVPLSYVKRHWAPYFDVLDYVDKPKQFWQAVLVVRRTRAAFG
jgi:SAM-dependent methyltransferase